MGVGHRLLALAAAQVGVHHAAGDGARPDDADLDHQVVVVCAAAAAAAWPSGPGSRSGTRPPCRRGRSCRRSPGRRGGCVASDRSTPLVLAQQVEGAVEHGQRAQPQQVDLEQPQGLHVVLVPLDHRAVAPWWRSRWARGRAPARAPAGSRRGGSTGAGGSPGSRSTSRTRCRAAAPAGRGRPAAAALQVEAGSSEPLYVEAGAAWPAGPGPSRAGPGPCPRRGSPSAGGSAPRWPPWPRGRGRTCRRRAGSPPRAARARCPGRCPAARRAPGDEALEEQVHLAPGRRR